MFGKCQDRQLHPLELKLLDNMKKMLNHVLNRDFLYRLKLTQNYDYNIQNLVKVNTVQSPLLLRKKYDVFQAILKRKHDVFKKLRPKCWPNDNIKKIIYIKIQTTRNSNKSG